MLSSRSCFRKKAQERSIWDSTTKKRLFTALRSVLGTPPEGVPVDTYEE